MWELWAKVCKEEGWEPKWAIAVWQAMDLRDATVKELAELMRDGVKPVDENDVPELEEGEDPEESFRAILRDLG